MRTEDLIEFNPGVTALERLVDMGLFAKGSNPSGHTAYWATKAPSAKDWPNAAGLVHTASRWVGTRGLTVIRGRNARDVMYLYDNAGSR